MTNTDDFSWPRLIQQAQGLPGVLDVDSSRHDRFSREDEDSLMLLADLYLSSVV